MSARLSTKGSYSIRFGKVEVVAKLPRGDWLWPAIWMAPLSSVYGPWPLSGEIDVRSARLFKLISDMLTCVTVNGGTRK